MEELHALQKTEEDPDHQSSYSGNDLHCYNQTK